MLSDIVGRRKEVLPTPFTFGVFCRCRNACQKYKMAALIARGGRIGALGGEVAVALGFVMRVSLSCSDFYEKLYSNCIFMH